MRSFLLFFPLLWAFWVNASQNDGNVAAEEMVRPSASFQESLLALHFENHPGWHTYWKNPGDAGLPIKTAFSVEGEPLPLESLEWPIPQRFREEGDIIAYGYDGAYSLFFQLPDNFFTTYRGKNLTISSNWLVCKHICIPEQKTMEIPIEPSSEVGQIPPKREIAMRLSSLPQQRPFPSHLILNIGLNEKRNGFIFLYSVSGFSHSLSRENLDILTPFPHKLFDFKHETLKVGQEGHLYGFRPSQWDGDYTNPKVPFPQEGVFDPPEEAKFLFNDPLTGEVFVVERVFDFFNPESFIQMKDFFAPLEDYVPGNIGGGVTSSLFFYLLLAFIGGLILNAMPCVLPVISIKLFGLIKHTGESNLRVFKHNIYYALGVITTFSFLAFIVIMLKKLGTSVGWGFQLQSPQFIVVMILVLLIFSLNLFGLFEFRTPGGKHLSSLNLEEGFSGDFMSGVLSTILSTPCSAPFLGTALTFAFTSSPLTILLVFIVIGLGLSSPFLLIGCFPSLVSFLPRPGVWMEHLKKFLGLFLILTIIWLLDVFSSQVDSNLHLVKLYTMMVLTFFAFYFRAKISKGNLGNAFFTALATLFFLHIISSDLNMMPVGGSDLINTKRREGLSWMPWSVEKMEEHQRNNERVFIDFTAKWCFTCKVNEKLVLDTEGFKKFARDNDIKLLLADWTRRDPVIQRWLRSQGFVGVPAYFVIKDGKIIKLGETITLGKIKKAFALQ